MRLNVGDPVEQHDTRSRPTPAAQEHIRLNTQPDGSDCGDCIRYGKDECPYPGSNPTMVMCNLFLLDIKQHDAAIRNTALENIIEQLSDLNHYSREEYKEASLSDNEREMRIHLEYGNRLWGIIRSLRTTEAHK
jgi:hypothetical protein